MLTGWALHKFINDRRMEGERLYGIVDAARDRELAFASQNILEHPLRPLMIKAPLRVVQSGPYLVAIDCHPRYPEYMDLWSRRLGTNAGVLFLANTWPQAMRDHLRDCFFVTDDTGTEFFFRFYDPRVLRPYLPTCTGREAKQFFGPIRLIFVEAETPGRIITCHCGQGAVEMAESPLAPDEDPSHESTAEAPLQSTP